MKRTITLQQDYDEMDEERPRKLYLSEFLSGDEKKAYQKQEAAKYAKKNAAKINEKRREKYNSDPKFKSKINVYSKKYYAKNRERILAKRKQVA